MAALEPDTPPPGEHIHLPGPSLQPILLALGITLTLVGVTLGIFLVVSGLILTVWVIVRWIADCRREMRALPEDLSSHSGPRAARANRARATRARCPGSVEGSARIAANGAKTSGNAPRWRFRHGCSIPEGYRSVTKVMESPTPIQRPATVRHRTSLFCDAVAIVEAEYSSDLSLDEIARRVASSRRQLQRSYAEIGDTTFREHLTGVRMERAAELLTTRGLTVREVAQRVGYRQPAQFAKAFRRHQASPLGVPRHPPLPHRARPPLAA